MTTDLASVVWPYLTASIVGAVIGFLFYGGLWLTVRKLAEARNPALLFAASFVIRTAITLGALYLVVIGDWRRVFPFMVCFIITRIILTRRWRPSTARADKQTMAV